MRNKGGQEDGCCWVLIWELWKRMWKRWRYYPIWRYLSICNHQSQWFIYFFTGLLFVRLPGAANGKHTQVRYWLYYSNLCFGSGSRFSAFLQNPVYDQKLRQFTVVITINVPLFKKLRDIRWLSHQKKIISQSFLNSGTLVILCIRVLLSTVVVCCCLLLGVLVCCCVLLPVRGFSL